MRLLRCDLIRAEMTKPFHVGLNLVYLVPGETGGMETYARELIEELVREAPHVAFTAFINREAEAAGNAPWCDLIPSVTVPVAARNRPDWVRGEQQLLPLLARKAGVHVMHSLASTAPIWGAFRRVTTIHDLHYRICPETHSTIRGAGMRLLVPLAAARSHRLISVSANTANDLVRLLKIPEEKIDIVPLGIGAKAVVNPVSESEIRAQLNLGDRRIALTLSAKRPHKNLMRLLEGLALIPAVNRPVLILPGYPTPHEDELKQRAVELAIQDDTRFLGWIDAAWREGLYGAASLFVFPSLYEGFGLPVLEAMTRSVPVACSNRGALREVAGDAALVFDPEDPRVIAAAMERLLNQPEEADRLRRAGQMRASKFTWQATARKTLAVYRCAFQLEPGCALGERSGLRL
jgi:glycosyltransferase involved in cell wall biosynthesis